MFAKVGLVLFLMFFMWLFFEAWRSPLYRENEDGSFTALADPKSLKDLWLEIKGFFKISKK